MTLTREQILASRKDRKPVRVEVPEWGGDVFVRVLSAAQSLEFTEGKSDRDVLFVMLVNCLVDEEGQRVFTDDDVEALAEEDFPVIMRVYQRVAEVNGLPTKGLEDAMESFKQAPDASSSTG